MNRTIDTAAMESAWDSGQGFLPHEIRCRLVHDGRANYLEVSRKGKRLKPVPIPELNPLDIPLYLTSVIAGKCPELTETELQGHERELRDCLFPDSLPAVTVCFGPRRKAQFAQQLHFSKEGFKTIFTDLNLNFHISGLSCDQRPPPYLRKWSCWIDMASVFEVEKLKLQLEKRVSAVISFDQATISIRAQNANTWLSAGFSSQAIQKYAAAQGVSLENLPDADGTTLAFRAGPKDPKTA